MLPIERVRPALHAIHRILVQARWMAYNQAPSDQMAAILDQAEILPTLLANDRDETAFFQMMLKGIAEKFPGCHGIFAEYLEVCGSAPLADVMFPDRELIEKMLAAKESETSDSPLAEKKVLPSR